MGVSTHPEIFVQVASYRDPQLVPTLEDCIAKAARPERLTFGICWQHDEQESIAPILEDDRMRVIAVEQSRARGPCWARNQLQQLYDGEEYTLQVDSHTRFTPGWDKSLIDMVEGLRTEGHEKPLLTSYAPHFDPADPPDRWHDQALLLVFHRYLPEGTIIIRPEGIPHAESLDKPIPARFYSAHFAFSLGRFAFEVMHDPDLYFIGEEPTISIRAFTHGYDLFHPHKVVLWHQYTRAGAAKHWEDDPKWLALNTMSLGRQRRLLHLEPGGLNGDASLYGLGTQRSLAEWEVYAGFDLWNQRVQQHTLAHHLPPNPPSSADNPWVSAIHSVQRFTVEVDRDELAVDDDVDEYYVGALGDDNVELFRSMIPADEAERLWSEDIRARTFEFVGQIEPVSWAVWPHSTRDGWMDKITGRCITETNIGERS